MMLCLLSDWLSNNSHLPTASFVLLGKMPSALILLANGTEEMELCVEPLPAEVIAHRAR
jgi:hypothetical protein